MKYYIEERGNCCTINYSFYGDDKNLISSITEKSGCCVLNFDEYDKYNTKTNGAYGKENYSSDNTFYEHDPNGDHIFIIIKIIVYF